MSDRRGLAVTNPDDGVAWRQAMTLLMFTGCHPRKKARHAGTRLTMGRASVMITRLYEDPGVRGEIRQELIDLLGDGIVSADLPGDEDLAARLEQIRVREQERQAGTGVATAKPLPKGSDAIIVNLDGVFALEIAPVLAELLAGRELTMVPEPRVRPTAAPSVRLLVGPAKVGDALDPRQGDPSRADVWTGGEVGTLLVAPAAKRRLRPGRRVILIYAANGDILLQPVNPILTVGRLLAIPNEPSSRRACDVCGRARREDAQHRRMRFFAQKSD